LRIDGFIAPARKRRFIGCPFQPPAPLLMQLLALQLEILGDLQADLDCRGGESASSISAATSASTGRALTD
jgi:hypothetical protein